MRNIDKIKELEDKVKVLTNQRDYLLRKKVRLTNDLDDLKKAHVEIQAVVDAVLLQTAIAYGEMDESGNYTIRMPRPYMNELDRYKVVAENDGNTRVIRAEVRRGIDEERSAETVSSSTGTDKSGGEAPEGAEDAGGQEV